MTGAFRPDYYMNRLQLPFPTRTRLLSTKKADREVRSTGCGVTAKQGLASLVNIYRPLSAGIRTPGSLANSSSNVSTKPPARS